MKRILIVFIPVLLLMACLPPHTKEAYLSQFEDLVVQTREKQHDPKFRWDKTDKRFEKYSLTYYQRFEDQLTFSENVRIKRLELEYLLIRTQNEVSILKQDFLNEINSTLEQLGSYIENNLQHDVDRFVEEGNQITNYAIDTMKQVFEKVRKQDFLTNIQKLD